ncbi:co-chaperone GroES [Candidatus Cytomitobacter indipagum]|uniref:Co-chaperonin GroES n=1 Tax=Candidatus Cytomitobacter indipagum TaxID=2601575 RepID=A0A5C0UEB3_9PROT|nr:co-chaperone GroES [Candidatus Cytomitobacter indipagum]QEK37993.1 co-chaperone GroES [Candidatus Cytomitobacter indipagum]
MSLTENDVRALEPLGDRVLVKKSDRSRQTASGIVLPETSNEDSITGTVISAGPGSLNDKGERISMQISVGDVVLFGQWAGTKINVSGLKDGTYVIIKSSDISGIIKGKSNE